MFKRAYLQDIRQRIIEQRKVGAHLINHSISEGYKLYYWRERNDEVDFVLEYAGKLIGLEVKSGRKFENKGMTVFAQKFNPTKVILVGTGGIPFDMFLQMNPIDLF